MTYICRCPSSAAKRLLGTGRILSLAVAQPVHQHEILFADEDLFNKGGVTNTRNLYVCSPQEKSPYAFTETHFQTRFLVKFGVTLSET
jgi:hypothetical protein